MSLHHMLRAAAGNAGPSDPYFEYNTLLLTGDGTNGAQNNTFLDSSTNNFTITRNGNTTQGSFSPYGNLWSNYFDGSGDYLTAGGTVNIGSGDYTIEAWVYMNSLPTYSMICGYGSQNYIGIRPTALAFGNSTGSTYPEWNFTFSTGIWYHVAVVKQSNTLKAFVNGTQLTLSFGSASSSAAFSAGQLYVGRYGGSPTYDFNGYISNFRAVNGTALYTSNFTPSTTPLTAVSGTSLLTCQSNRFIDNSSNNFTLTVNGNTSVQRFSPFNPTAPYSAATIGGSGYFDGSGDYITSPYSTTAFDWWATDYTIEAWVYPTTLTGWGYVDGVSTQSSFIGNASATSTTNYWSFGPYTDGTVKFKYYNGSSVAVTSSQTVKVGQWNHVAMTKTSSGIIVWVNGIGMTAVAVSGTPQSSAGTALIIGQINNACINGYTSNIRIVKGTAVYTSNFTPPTAPLTAITNTSLLCNFTNAGIPDAAMMNDLETVGNAQVSTSVKKYGTGSLAFDGTGDYLICADSPNLAYGTGDFTVEAWIYPTSTPSNQVFIDQRESSPAGGGFSLECGSDLKPVVATSVAVITSSTAMTINTWNYVAYSRSGTSLKLFLNGIQVGSVTNSANLTSQRFTLGAYTGRASSYAFGYIDDLRITKGIARYTANFTPPTAALPTY